MDPIETKYAITYYSTRTGYNTIYFDHLPTAQELFFIVDPNIKRVTLWKKIDGEFKILSLYC